MIELLRKILREIDEAAEDAVLNDHTYTEYYRSLRKKRKVILCAIKKLEKIKKNND